MGTAQSFTAGQLAIGGHSAGSQFVAVGSSGTIITSPDGVSWTSRTSGTSDTLNGITWSGSQFAAVGDNGTIITSPDGKYKPNNLATRGQMAAFLARAFELVQ